ncbi:MAG: hypothetical protein HPY69_21550, partial [Armatimonadetes bacterium]|nr:hypothetical protein [Armatimonadota bacterium]
MALPRWSAVVWGTVWVAVAHGAVHEHRAIWANHREILTPDKVRQTVERVAA